MVLHEALRLRRTATSAEVWVMLGVETFVGTSSETFSAVFGQSPLRGVSVKHGQIFIYFRIVLVDLKSGVLRYVRDLSNRSTGLLERHFWAGQV